MVEMEKIQVISITGKEIKVKSVEDMETLYNYIDEEEDIILQWKEDGQLKSVLMLTEGIIRKVKDGSMVLTSSEKIDKKETTESQEENETDDSEEDKGSDSKW